MNTKTFFGVNINLDQIKTVETLRAAELFEHLENPAEKEDEVIKELNLPNAADVNRGPVQGPVVAEEAPAEEAPAEEAPAEEAPAEEAPAEEAPAEEVEGKKKKK